MKVKFTYLLIGLMMMSIGPSNADIYSWTGEDGVLYFSDKPGHPDAQLYIKVEPEPVKRPIQSVPTPIETTDRTRDEDALTEDLEAANAQLSEALDRIEKLSEQVETAESKAETAAAAASVAAQEAADYAQHAAESADNSNRRQRTVYYGSPYPYKQSHKPRIVKKHHRGVHPKDFKNKSRFGHRNHSAGHKGKHHLKKRSYNEYYNRFADRKGKKYYRRPPPANSIGPGQRKIGRNSLGTSFDGRQGRPN